MCIRVRDLSCVLSQIVGGGTARDESCMHGDHLGHRATNPSRQIRISQRLPRLNPPCLPPKTSPSPFHSLWVKGTASLFPSQASNYLQVCFGGSKMEIPTVLREPEFPPHSTCAFRGLWNCPSGQKNEGSRLRRPNPSLASASSPPRFGKVLHVVECS